MLPEIGNVVDEKYVIEGQLGKGGMAVVFAAHHTVLDRAVAMKVLSPDLPRTPQLVQRFLAEARAAARVDSAHVARVFDAGTLDDGSPFIVMERLEGCDLDELLLAYKRLPIGEAVDHVLQALQGLAHAHVLGVVHRDLKPANLFLAAQPDHRAVIKILDFGIAKLVDEARMMASGQVMGSPMYMAPEQVRDAELVDPRADIWSIGVVLYELLTGQTPFEADGIGKTLAAVLDSTPDSSRTLRPEVPPELDAAILRCLRQAPDERFPDVWQLAVAIAPFGTGACTPLVDAIEHTLRQRERFSGPGVVGPVSVPSLRELATVRIAFAEARDEAAYVYGDGTPSSLHTNFFVFLEDALDCIAQVLAFDDLITKGREDLERLPQHMTAEVERLAGIVSATKEAVARAPKGPADSPSARVGAATVASLEALVPEEVAKLQAQLDADLRELPIKEAAAREGCARAFEALLRRHDLPGSVLTFQLRRAERDRYAARITGAVKYGLRWALELELPPEHTLARTVKLDKLARIEVEGPELTGWLKKEIKLRPQRLDRFYLTELVIDSASMSLKLRADSNGEGEGYDVEVDLPASRFQLARPSATEAPYDLSEADAAKLTELHRKLLAVARELAPARKRLVDCAFDEGPLWVDHDPRLVVERLVRVIQPIVREIAIHSPSPSELALKQLTADKRREEVFVAKSALLAKLAAVPERLRPVVAPLVLVLESVGIRSSQPSSPHVV